MRVLQVHSEFWPQSSGVARHMAGLVKELERRGDIHSTILVQSLDGMAGASFRCSDDGFGGLSRHVAACDVVHAHGGRTLISAAALRLARLLGKPAVFTPHCYYQGGSAVRRLGKRLWDLGVERFSVADADAVILLHEGWVDILRDMGMRPRRVEVIPNCVDLDVIQDRFATARTVRLSGAPALLSVGRVDPIKRLDDVVRALTRPGLERGELHVVGRGDHTPRLMALVAELGLGGRVHFLGWRDDDETAAMMRGCDAMILASEREGLPTVLLEALACGVPILASDIDGNRAITDVVGWPHLFPLGDIDALAIGLAGCAGVAVPDRVRDSVRRVFSWQSRAADVAALYAGLCERRVGKS